MHEQLKLSNQLCFRLYTVTRLITQAYRPLLDPLGLTYPQYLVMMVLWEQDNQTVGDIGRRLMLDTNTLTPMLQRMEREGLLVRTHGISDGRQTLVSLTKKGIHLEEQAKDIPACMSQNWHGDTMSNDQLNSMVNAIDTLINGMR
jgi:DNA-binding MarR family transcriptional regulator